ncbi:MAG: hypothetical protein K2P60_05325, partial [Lachnospiraceae bacterium]|nr:hypothetical protein [Lachnospiraceae bacterium]
MEHFDELVTVPGLKQAELRKFDEEEGMENQTFQNCHVVHSSGSTGIPGYFIYDEDAWNQMLLGIIRGTLWNMTMPQIIKLLIGRPKILTVWGSDGCRGWYPGSWGKPEISGYQYPAGGMGRNCHARCFCKRGGLHSKCDYRARAVSYPFRKTCLKADEIVLTEFVAGDLGVGIGDTVAVSGGAGSMPYRCLLYT